MPTVSIERDVLFAHLGRSYSDEAFDELCFEFGVELDEITSEREEALKNTATSSTHSQQQQQQQLSDKVLYKIDVPANRYDLLCVEGLTRALKIFLGDVPAPHYQTLMSNNTDDTNSNNNNNNNNNNSKYIMNVHKSRVDSVRPFVVCAVLRNLEFTPERYRSFLDLQEQLHRNLCRQRTLVAIGTHDLDAIQAPFCYDAQPPHEISFVPLTPSNRTFTAAELLEFYETDVTAKHLKPYVSIIRDSSLYPVILDANQTVLSLPPIINGAASKISLPTKNVFIECTATDLTKANIVLDTLVCMFSEYCAQPYTAEAVTVNYLDDQNQIVNSYMTPRLSTRRERAAVQYCNSLIGIQLSAGEMRDLCNKIQLGPAELLQNDTVLEVTVPPTRSDILHACDIAEDIGTAFGYNKIVRRVPHTSTVGGEFPLNQISDLLRDEIGRAGYTEVLTHGLCSLRDNFTTLRRPVELNKAVSLANPANIEYQVVRTTLLPGLLKTLQHNKSASFTAGFKLFEIADVVLVDQQYCWTETIVGARNARRVGAVYAGPTSGFEIIHGLVDRIMTLTEIAPEPAYCENSAKSDEEQYRVCRDGWWYTIAPLEATAEDDDDDQEVAGLAGTYFPGRAAKILLTSPDSQQKRCIGTFGILHPEVLANFDIQYPASCVELDLEALM